MPIYAYKCGSCGHAKDVLQKLSDSPLTVCPACGAAAFTKQVTAAGFQLKGSGWYATDFRGGSSGAPPAADAASKDGASKDGASKDGEGAKPADGAVKPADSAAKPSVGAAKPADSGSASPKSDGPKASTGACSRP